jgi:hypothetical protein
MLELDDLEPELVVNARRLLARSLAADGRLDEARAEIRAALAVGVDATTWHGYPHYQLGLGPVTDCGLRLAWAEIELQAGEPARAQELVERMRLDCPRATGRLRERLGEVEAQLVLASPRLGG